jgi:hypothetical protein
MEKINEGGGSAPTPPTFTPGPWEVGKASDGTWYVHEAAALGFRPAWVPAGCLGAVRPGLNAEANARLVAAAPEMYEALRVFAALGNEVPSTLLDDKPLYAIGSSKAITAGDLRRATAALAEAEGRPSSLGPAPKDCK